MLLLPLHADVASHALHLSRLVESWVLLCDVRPSELTHTLQLFTHLHVLRTWQDARRACATGSAESSATRASTSSSSHTSIGSGGSACSKKSDCTASVAAHARQGAGITAPVEAPELPAQLTDDVLQALHALLDGSTQRGRTMQELYDGMVEHVRRICTAEGVPVGQDVKVGHGAYPSVGAYLEAMLSGGRLASTEWLDWVSLLHCILHAVFLCQCIPVCQARTPE